MSGSIHSCFSTRRTYVNELAHARSLGRNIGRINCSRSTLTDRPTHQPASHVRTNRLMEPSEREIGPAAAICRSPPHCLLASQTTSRVQLTLLEKLCEFCPQAVRVKAVRSSGKSCQPFKAQFANLEGKLHFSSVLLDAAAVC